MTRPETYRPPLILFNRHAETIFPSLFRKVEIPSYTRERIVTPDDDFLDLDWVQNGSQNLTILSHGLEGNSNRPYIMGMARAFSEIGCDVLAWNYRGCSQEVNRQLRFYHSGATDDLTIVVNHARNRGYRQLVLIGFSLGGNLTLKYLGELGSYAPTEIKGAVAISVPLDLYSSCLEISKPHNRMYAQRFLKSLKRKVIEKAKTYPSLSTEGLGSIRTLIDFDNQYTSKLHGFRDAIDYYQKCSSLNFLKSISRPTLLINALNDPFLSPSCFPDLSHHEFIEARYPTYGGHVGFTLFNQNGLYWSELSARHFTQSVLHG